MVIRQRLSASGHLAYADHFLMNSVLAGLFDRLEVIPGREVFTSGFGIDAAQLFFSHRFSQNIFGFQAGVLDSL
jgi:hypothetical protein